MASTVILSDNGVSSGSAGLKETGGNDGTLLLQTTTSGGTATTAVTIDNSQNTTLAGVLSLSGTTIPSAGTSRLFSRTSDSSTYLQTATGGSFYLLDGSQNTMYSAASTSHNWSISNAVKMTLDASSNLGLGVTPSSWYAGNSAKAFEIGSAGNGILQYGSGSNITSYYLNNAYLNASASFTYGQSSGGASYYRQNNGIHSWAVAGSGTAGNPITFTTGMTLDASSNLTLGFGGSGNNNQFLYINGTSAANFGSLIRFQQNGTQCFDVGDYAAIVSGSSHLLMCRNTSVGVYLATASANSWSAVSSDAREKKDFASVEGLDAVLQVEPVKFRYKWETDADPIHMGFTAQNLKPLIPDMVIEREEKAEDGTPLLTITSDYILPVLVKAIQEQQALIQTLTERVAALEGAK